VVLKSNAERRSLLIHTLQTRRSAARIMEPMKRIQANTGQVMLWIGRREV
jgi:hypothetical protein